VAAFLAIPYREDMTDRKKNPKRDVNEVAFDVVKKATDPESSSSEGSGSPPDDGKNPAAVELGRKGGRKGGKARAESLSPARRREIAKKAARARWKSDS
jgi:hypothetical protein